MIKREKDYSQIGNEQIRRDPDLEPEDFEAFADEENYDDENGENYEGDEEYDDEGPFEEEPGYDQYEPQQLPQLSPEEEKRRKIEMLNNLHKYVSEKSYTLPVHLDLNSNYNDIEYHYEMAKRNIKLKAEVGFARNLLMFSTYMVENGATRWNPDTSLRGWNSYINQEISSGSYDEVLRELCEKYSNLEAFGPEIRLIFMIISSATIYSVSQQTNLDLNKLMKGIGPTVPTGTGPKSDPIQELSEEFNGISDDTLSMYNEYMGETGSSPKKRGRPKKNQ